MKTALIMEGGAMRGMFTCGVIDVFMRSGITFDGAAGISAGAVFGCNFKSRQIGRPIRYNMRYCRDPRYGGLRSLIRTGDLYGADFCYRELPDELDVFDREAFRQNPMEFYVGATDVGTGKAVYHRCMDGGPEDMLWLRASASMPVVSRPVEIGGALLLDGGIADAVPYAMMEEKGYDRNVIVLTQPSGYRDSPVSRMIRFMARKYPYIASALSVRHEMYNRQMEEIDEREASGRSLVIRPPRTLEAGYIEKNPLILERVYRVGVQEAERRLDDVRAFLAGRAD